MITELDLKNLEIVFTLARKQLIENEDELINLINFKRSLFEKLKAAVSANIGKKEDNNLVKAEAIN